ncbi:MAG: aldo/keto reductase [Deltaproteobacteria bacterium]|nr:aldo/keto reductase [Deltaproteobacteria bacterium]
MVTATPSFARRPLGRTGLQVTPLGLAALAVPAWRPGGSALRAADVERAFHEHGVNTFLAHPLMKELCVGVKNLIAKGHRSELVLVSETGLPFAGAVRRDFEKNLAILGTDYLDVFLVGWVRNRWFVRDAVWGTLRRFRADGRVKAIGFSSHDRPLAAKLAVELDADVLMIRYNAAHRGAEREVFAPLAALGSKRPGIIAYTATRWGLLLKPLPKKGFAEALSGAECYRFVLGHPMVDVVWCAARTAAELDADVVGVGNGPLTGERRDYAVRFGDAVHRAAKGGFRWMFGKDAS